jgi:hypothetical protein
MSQFHQGLKGALEVFEHNSDYETTVKQSRCVKVMKVFAK